MIIVAVMACSMAFPAVAESPEWEAVAGMNFSTINRDGIGFRHGFHAGMRMTFEVPSVTQGFYINTAALLSLEGYKTDSISYSPFFINIPVHAGYKYEIDNPFAMFIECGPYFGIGAFGKAAGKNVFSDEVGYNRFNFGVGFRGGFVFYRKYSVSLGGDFGFLKMNKDSRSKPRNIYLSLGYKF